jgi:hypothetical protein
MPSIDTVNDLPPRVQYIAAAAQTDFDYPFPIFEDEDLVVNVDGVDLALTTHYSVSGEGDDTGGTVTLVTPMDGDEIVTIYRDIAITRDTDMQQNGPWRSDTYNDEQDKIILILQQLEARIQRSLRLPIISEAADADLELAVASWANMYLTFDADGVPTPAALSDTAMTQAIIGQLLYPLSTAEVLAGKTPSVFFYKHGHVRRWGATGDGTTDDSDAINDAISIGKAVYFDDGDYRANNLTGTADLQQFIGEGAVYIRKNANGDLFTHSGDDVYLNNLDFRGESSTPAFTGNNIVLTGERPTLVTCSSQWAVGRALKATGNRVRLLGSRGIYQTTDATATGYDIEIGVSGTATLYHSLSDFNTSQATGGILFIDCGGQSIKGCQFGKLRVQSGTSPAGVNGGSYSNNRINGNVTIEISNSAFSANVLSTVTVTFGAGTSGHSFDRSNVVASGATITDNSNTSVVEDARLVPYQSWTPVITASGGGFVLGNGVIVARYSKRGKEVSVFFRFIPGGTTVFGTGFYTISLPTIPNTTFECLGISEMFDSDTGVFRIGAVRTSSSGVASMRVSVDSGTSFVGATVPFTWATSDEWRIRLTYFED